MRTRFARVAVGVAMIGAVTAWGSPAVDAATFTGRPIERPAERLGTTDEFVPESEIEFLLTDLRMFLDMMRSDLERGMFGTIDAAQWDAFDELEARVAEFDSRRARIGPAEWTRLNMDVDAFLADLGLWGPSDVFPGPAADRDADAVAPSPVTDTIPATDTIPVTDSIPATGAPVSSAPASTIPPPTTTPSPTPVSAAPVATAPATTAPVVTPIAAPATAEASSRSDRLLVVLLGAIVAAGLLAVVGYLVDHGRTRRSPDDGPVFQDLLDVGRRLASVSTVAEAEQAAVHQAMRLTVADAGAFVRSDTDGDSVSYESADEILVPDRLGDGALHRVLRSGQALIQTTSTESAIRNVPVSLLAIPIVAAGSVHGAIVLLRDASRPFGDAESRVASDLTSVVGAAVEQAQQTERVRAEALADGLTGVKNRRALDLDIAGLDDRPFAATMVDLDHFKRVNDTYGHQAGDELLQAVAERIATHLRPNDELYRYGGEEFAIVMPGTEIESARDIAERVRHALAATPFRIGPRRVEYAATASLGVAIGDDGPAVLARADEALYEAKRGGRDRVVVANTGSIAGPIADVVERPAAIPCGDAGSG